MKITNKIKIAILLLSIFLYLYSCKQNTKEKTDDNLELLYSDFAKVIKDKNKYKLVEFSRLVSPDEETAKYLREQKFSYNEFPKNTNIKTSQITEEYLQTLLNFKEMLELSRRLENLKYLGQKNRTEKIINEKLKIRLSNTTAILKSGNDTIEFKLGEMLYINGKWKAFSKPNFVWKKH